LDARSELRHELKFTSDESAYSELVMMLRLDRAGVRTLHPRRRVQSLYLDTTFQRSLEDNMAGLGAREKVRLRWYGEDGTSVLAVLERKRRENSLGWKETQALSQPIQIAGAQRRSFMRELERRCDERWRRHVLHGLEPVQWISYEREYFTSADRRVRLTLDRRLRCADQRPLSRLTDAPRSPAPRVLVLELKCAPEHLASASDLAGRISIPLGRCSKYVLACDPGHGPLPSILAL